MSRWRMPTRPTGRRWVNRKRRTVALAVAGVVVIGGGTAYGALAVFQTAGPKKDGTAITSIGWHVTPAGRQTQLGERPYGLALSPDGRQLLVSNVGVAEQSVMLVDVASGRVTSTVAYRAPEAVHLGVGWSPDGSTAYVAGGANDKVRVYRVAGNKLQEQAPLALRAKAPNGKAQTAFATGLALSKDGRQVYVANHLVNAVSIVDVATGRESRVPLSAKQCPVDKLGFDPSFARACDFAYTVAFSRTGRHAYVSHWGKNFLSVIDTRTRKVTGHITVGTHPSAMTANPKRDELYVANTDSDSISVVDTATNRLKRSLSVSPYPGARVGTQPNALAVSPDGKTLYAANAGNNDIDVIALERSPSEPDRIEGLIPTGWYPTGVAVSPDGRHLYVENGKGLGAGPNPGGPVPVKNPETTPDQYIGSMIKGTLSTVRVPTGNQIRPYTRQVVENNGFDELGDVRLARRTTQHVVPRKVGDDSPIKHVIYVINENRTYDQVLGDLGKGNGDPSLTLFDRRSAPNHHKLAAQFVTLDNIYAAGEVSQDGWEWSTAANANTFNVKNQPTNYGGRGHFYVGEGGSLAAASGVSPRNSYIWDRLARQDISFRNYGFWATGEVPAKVYNEPELDRKTDHRFPGYNLAIPDQQRFTEWLREFRGYERAGRLPSVQFVKFPNDHTCGTRPGCPTPQAMVADSDWATGKLVDAVSHSKFWKDTAIFIIEDDAQDGPDHVDAHRVLAHVVSPYTQTGKVDSVFYSSVSMLRTMELILGIGPLTQFDAAANPMFNSFTDARNMKPFVSEKPEQPLDEMNKPGAPMAAESARMDLSKEDRAPEQLLNEAIWKGVKGADSKMPAPKQMWRDADEDD